MAEIRAKVFDLVIEQARLLRMLPVPVPTRPDEETEIVAEGHDSEAAPSAKPAQAEEEEEVVVAEMVIDEGAADRVAVLPAAAI